MIITNDLSKKYGEQTALHKLNLNIKSGEIYCLLGANGAGKRQPLICFWALSNLVPVVPLSIN